MSQTGSRAEGHAKVATDLIHDGVDTEGDSGSRSAGSAALTARTALTFHELVELWHHQHNVAMHKERLYIPSSIAVLVGTILGWKDLSATVVALGAVASIGLYWYLALIMDDFARRQDRFFAAMCERRSEILRIMFNQSVARFAADDSLVGARTVQRGLRWPFVGTLIAVWLVLIAIKLNIFA